MDESFLHLRLKKWQTLSSHPHFGSLPPAQWHAEFRPHDPLCHLSITTPSGRLWAIPRHVTCLSKGENTISSPYHAARNCTRQLLKIPTSSWPSGNQWETNEWGQNIMMEHNQHQWKVRVWPVPIGGQYPDGFLIMFTSFLRLEASLRTEMFSCFQDDIY